MNYIPEPKPIPELIAKFMMNDLAGILKKMDSAHLTKIAQLTRSILE